MEAKAERRMALLKTLDDKDAQRRTEIIAKSKASDDKFQEQRERLAHLEMLKKEMNKLKAEASVFNRERKLRKDEYHKTRIQSKLDTQEVRLEGYRRQHEDQKRIREIE